MLALLLALLLTPAHAHDMAQAGGNPELERVYAFYDSWKRPPDRTYSCCSKIDCHDVDVKQENGHWLFLDKHQNLWRQIPDNIIESNRADGRDSPDGKNHVCYNSMYVFCAVLGAQI